MPTKLWTAVGACALMAVSGCSTGQESATASGPRSPATTASSPDAAEACGEFFALDLLLRRLVVGSRIESTSDATLRSWNDYRDGVVAFVMSGGKAVRTAGLPNEVLTHANRILSMLGGGGRDDMTAMPAARIEAVMRYGRSIEVICVASGVPIPQANLDARAASP